MSTKLYPNSQLNRSLRRNWQNPTVMFSSVTLSSYLDINCELLTVMDGYKLEYNVRKCRTSYYEFKQYKLRANSRDILILTILFKFCLHSWASWWNAGRKISRGMNSLTHYTFSVNNRNAYSFIIWNGGRLLILQLYIYLPCNLHPIPPRQTSSSSLRFCNFILFYEKETLKYTR